MSENSDPLPPNLDNTWILYLYGNNGNILQKEIQRFQMLIFQNPTTSESAGRGEKEDPISLSDSESSSDDDLSSYYPNKRCACGEAQKET